jgi:predicted nucleic acid-binding protein
VTRFVLDASVALAWVADRDPDPYAEIVRQRIRGGARPVVPALWQLEVANTLALIRRRKVLTDNEVEEGLDYMHTFATTVAEIDANSPTVREAFRVSTETGLSAYDAVYFDLARRDSLPLATLDKNLRQAAVKAGIAAL